MGNGDAKQEQPKEPLIEYPTVYPFKIMGRQEHGFLEYARHLVGRVLGTEISRDSVSAQPSSGNHYLSVTVSVYLISEEQRRRVYEALHRDRRVLYYL